MNRLVMSAAASGLVRALIRRADVPQNRILLTNVQSVDWQSLTFTGERHQLQLRVPGPDAQAIVRRLCGGLEEADFSIRGLVVADITLAGAPEDQADGSIALAIEALTIVDD